MLRSVIKAWAFIGLTTILAACGGGDDIQGFTDFTNLQLSDIQVSGGTMLYAEVEVERFDPENVGPYRIELDSEETTSISVTAIAESPDDVFLQLVETGKEEDGSNRITQFNSGDTVPVPVDEGSSLVYVEVVSRETGGALRYNLTFNRVSSSAELLEVQIFGLTSSQSSSNVSYSEPVSADVLAYDVNLSFEVCSTSFRAFATNQFTSIRVNGETLDFAERIYLDLNVGSNIVNVELTSEDEQNVQTYVFDLLRAEPTEEDLASYQYLESLNISGGRAFPEFRCNTNGISITLGNSDDAFSVTPTVAQEDAEILIAPIVLDSNNTNWVLDESSGSQVLTSGEAYSGELLSNLDFGTTNIGIQVTSSDDSTSHIYPLFINRVDQKLVFVDTSEALQSALRNAVPGDQILVAEGEYQGVVSNAESDLGSGDSTAHFYSNASGEITEDVSNRIILFGEGSGAVFVGDNTAENSALKIQGNHWNIENISVRDSGKGLEIINSTDVRVTVIDATNTSISAIHSQDSSDITLNGVLVSGVQGAGVSLQGVSQSNVTNFSIREVEGNALTIGGGSSGNVIKNGDINEIGSEEAFAAVLIGGGEGDSSDNRIEFVGFGRNMASEAINIIGGADDTYIQSNHFDTDNTAFIAVEDRRLIRVASGNATISANQFSMASYESGTDSYTSVIEVNSSDAETTLIYDNAIDFEDESIPFIDVSSVSSVQALSNSHASGSEPITVGSVGVLNALPTFQIQSTVDNTLCFQADLVRLNYESASDAVVELNMVTLKTCEDIPAQRWVMQRGFDNFVTLSPESNAALKMTYTGLPFSYTVEDDNGDVSDVATTDTFVYLREDDDSVLDNQFALLWKVEHLGDGTVSIENLDSSYSFNLGDSLFRVLESTLDPLEVDEQLLFYRVAFSGESTRFNLIPL